MQKLFRLVYKTYASLIEGASWLQSPFLLFVRLYWGWQFFLTGKGKLGNIGKTAEFFQSLGLPHPTLQALIAGSTECLGGLLLLLGVASRLVSIPLAVTMIVAYVTADFEKVKNLFSEPDKFVSADPFLFMLAAFIVLLFGPGRFSLDALIRRLFLASRSTEAEARVARNTL